MRFFRNLVAVWGSFWRGLESDRRLILTLARNDFDARYAGSILGIAWAFIQQLVTLGIFYFVFVIGFRSAPIDNHPYFLWLCSGMIPWFFFQDAWPRATASLHEYNYMVKRMNFRVAELPLIRILSSFIIHVCFIILMMIVFVCFGYYPSIFWLQLPYYILSNFALLLSISWITSSIVVFYRDIDQFLVVFMQILFWLTPLCWIPPLPLVTYNPLSYIVMGFRDSMLFNTWFWQKPVETMSFWAVLAVLSLASIGVYKSLRPHFPEVL